MLTFNGLYLLAVLENTPYLIPIQASLALFKFGWNQLTAMVALSRFSSSSEQRAVDVLLSSLQVFNFVLAPCIATAVSDSNCFYELFSRQPSQAGSANGQCFNYEYAYINGTVVPVCLQFTESAGLAQPFNPPFVYHYQCGSALIVNYVPVLLYAFVFGSVASPAVLLLCLRYRADILRYCPQLIVDKVFARLYCMHDNIGNRDSSGDRKSVSKHGQMVTTLITSEAQSKDLALSGQKKRPLFRGGLFMNLLMLHVVVLMTFGLAAPYLAFIVVCSFFSKLIVLWLLVSRYLSICCYSGFPDTAVAGGDVSELPARSPNTLHVILSPEGEEAKRHQLDESSLQSANQDGDHVVRLSNDEEAKGEMPLPPRDQQLVGASSSSLLLAAALREVEEALEGVWAYPYDGMWAVVLVAQLFWALLFFDMVGDVYGYEAGLQAMVATMLCLPLLTYWLARVGLHCQPYCDWQIRRNIVSDARAQRRAAESEERSLELSAMETWAEEVGHLSLSLLLLLLFVSFSTAVDNECNVASRPCHMASVSHAIAALMLPPSSVTRMQFPFLVRQAQIDLGSFQGRESDLATAGVDHMNSAFFGAAEV